MSVTFNTLVVCDYITFGFVFIGKLRLKSPGAISPWNVNTIDTDNTFRVAYELIELFNVIGIFFGAW
jgi:hypothetical protein